MHNGEEGGGTRRRPESVLKGQTDRVGHLLFFLLRAVLITLEKWVPTHPLNGFK